MKIFEQGMDSNTGKPEVKKREIYGDNLEKIDLILQQLNIDEESKNKIHSLFDNAITETTGNMVRSKEAAFKEIESSATSDWSEVSELAYIGGAHVWNDFAEELKKSCPSLEVKVELDNFSNNPVKVRKQQ